MNIADKDARDETSERGNLLFLMSWWSEHYNRPLKDPLLQEYTIEELAYEYYGYHKRKQYIQEKYQENDKIEEEQAWEDAEAWADAMEAADAESPQEDPREDPANQQWMQGQIDLAKKEIGEDFGEDTSISFGDD